MLNLAVDMLDRCMTLGLKVDPLPECPDIPAPPFIEPSVFRQKTVSDRPTQKLGPRQEFLVKELEEGDYLMARGAMAVSIDGTPDGKVAYDALGVIVASYLPTHAALHIMEDGTCGCGVMPSDVVKHYKFRNDIGAFVDPDGRYRSLVRVVDAGGDHQDAANLIREFPDLLFEEPA